MVLRLNLSPNNLTMKQSDNAVVFSAPGKVHLLGEHSVVYGKPALLATVGLRVTVTIKPITYNDTIVHMYVKVKNALELIIKKHLKIETIPPYQLIIDSQIPLGCGLGSSAAISAAYIAALLTFLKAKWDLNLINQLTFEAEKVFHGNPSGADNSTIVFGGLIWFRKETENLNLIQPLNIIFSRSRNFVLINTGKPKESTKEMVGMVNSKIKNQKSKFKRLFDDQEQLTKKLSQILQKADEKELIRIIKAGERNLESIGVVSKQAISIIRKIEESGGAAKICGGGGITGPTGVLLCYHSKPKIIQQIAKSLNLDYFNTALGMEGLRRELTI